MKRNPPLTMLCIYYILLGLTLPFLPIYLEQMVAVTSTLVGALALMWWMELDLMKRGRTLSNAFRWFTVLLTAPALVVHFLRTRTLFGTAWSIILAILVALLAMVLFLFAFVIGIMACQLDFVQDYCRPEFIGE
jgi:hypothetical protein